MSDADWPAPEPRASREPAERSSPLPRVEDLPIAEQGYDREKVREAFDAFYRHTAQLDATLRTLESVEVFQRTAAELRAELRTIRGSGWTVQSWRSGPSYGTRPAASEWTLPPSFPRVAAEAVFLIVVGVVVGIAGWTPLTIVAVMGAALAVVWLIEWAAARERAIPQASAPAAVPVLDEEPAELPSAAAVVTPAEEGPEALTILDAPPLQVEDEAAPVDEEPEAAEAPDEPVQPELPEEPVVEDTAEELEGLVEPVHIEAVFEPRAAPDPATEPEPAPEPELEPEPEPEPEEAPVAELVVEEPVAAAAPVVAEEVEPEPDVVELAEPPRERRRFRLFRRAAAVEAVAAVPVEEDATDEDVRVDEPKVAEAAPQVDPWEQEPSLPDEPEVSQPEPAAEEPEPFEHPEPEEPFVTPAPEEPFVDPETPSPFEQPETPPFWEPPQGDADEPPTSGLADEPAEEEPELQALPVDALAEQAAAALERSRARRRAPRRARRR
jgi:hypothetical protein